MKIIFIVIVVLGLIFFVKMNKNQIEENVSQVSVVPISHASMVLNWDGMTVYTDPVGEAKVFEGLAIPDLILLTDIHGDHLDVEALKTVTKAQTIIVAPQAVADEIPEELKPQVLVMNNGEVLDHAGFKIEAIPMYNLPESPTSYHLKGRGNGYVVERGDKRVYISGDTAGIPEMRNLIGIDLAFVAMNLPYTMGVEEAADAVLAFKPGAVYPYHYRTPEGFSDVAKFKQIVNAGNKEVEVIQLEWYPAP
ncbi:MAG TPA: MBL fold metallo-hydrolase [Candidatus Paceibacterota bacterium]